MGDSVEILMVDDVPANLEIMTDILSAAGYSVAAVTNGERALKRLQTYTPSLILLDIQMPGLNGFETCRRIISNPRTANIPIIFITALSDSHSIAKGFELGAVDYISKPFQSVELLARVRTHLNLNNIHQVLEHQVQERTYELELTMIQLRDTLLQLKASQLQTIQREKMASLGDLVAGVAHEINNPLSFINGSISTAQCYMQALLEHLKLYQTYYPQPIEAVKTNAEDIELDFLQEDFPKLIKSMQKASDCICTLSTSLRNFARTDNLQKVKTDIHQGLDSALLMLKYRLKATEYRPEIKVIKNYEKLPLTPCFSGQINQVFMNILANSIDIFDEGSQYSSYEEIEAKTQLIAIKTNKIIADNIVEICIADNGKGMTSETKKRIFDHGFTTKGVGKGTGLGLAIAHHIITEVHGGTIDVTSAIGCGTEFCIHLPLAIEP